MVKYNSSVFAAHENTTLGLHIYHLDENYVPCCEGCSEMSVCFPIHNCQKYIPSPLFDTDYLTLYAIRIPCLSSFTVMCYDTLRVYPCTQKFSWVKIQIWGTPISHFSWTKSVHNEIRISFTLILCNRYRSFTLTYTVHSLLPSKSELSLQWTPK